MGTTWTLPRTTGRQPVEGESEMGSANTSTPVFWVDYNNISPTGKTEKKKKTYDYQLTGIKHIDGIHHEAKTFETILEKRKEKNNI